MDEHYFIKKAIYDLEMAEKRAVDAIMAFIPEGHELIFDPVLQVGMLQYKKIANGIIYREFFEEINRNVGVPLIAYSSAEFSHIGRALINGAFKLEKLELAE